MERSVIFVGLFLYAAPLSAQTAQSCERVANLALPNTTITFAHSTPAGTFTPPGPPAPTPNLALSNLPAFCRVTATLKPTTDSDIKIEVWLPIAGWNGKLQSVGNGAWGGVIPYPALGGALASGYATAGTDTGHTGNTASFAPGHPEKLADYGYRAVHEMTVAAKAIVDTFYGNAPKLSYWNACSTGGRQGLMEAQRFPADYDGIIAGAPANYREEQLIWQLWVAHAVHHDQASYIPPEKYLLIHKAAVDMCDARDGVKDGLLENPAQCRFDPKVLECKNGDAPLCLTAQQVEAARKICSPVINPRTKEEIFPGMQPGSELGWAALAGPQPRGEGVEFFEYVVFNDPNWDFRTLDFETAANLAAKADNGMVAATNPNLKAFFDRGGKLLMYHGWSDQLVAPLSSVKYYKSVVDATGGAAKASNSIRLFMMPGMNHCQGGEGPDVFDKVGVLEKWVEQGQAPARITAAHSTNGKIDRTRPLCPYPLVAGYVGAGAIDDDANFVCKAP